MPGFVADASTTLPWCFASEAMPWTEAMLDRLQAGEQLVVPAHWPIEGYPLHLMGGAGRRRAPAREDFTR